MIIRFMLRRRFYRAIFLWTQLFSLAASAVSPSVQNQVGQCQNESAAGSSHFELFSHDSMDVLSLVGKPSYGAMQPPKVLITALFSELAAGFHLEDPFNKQWTLGGRGKGKIQAWSQLKSQNEDRNQILIKLSQREEEIEKQKEVIKEKAREEKRELTPEEKAHLAQLDSLLMAASPLHAHPIPLTRKTRPLFPDLDTTGLSEDGSWVVQEYIFIPMRPWRSQILPFLSTCTTRPQMILKTTQRA